MFKGVFFQHLGYFLDDMAKISEINVETRRTLLDKYANFVHANASAVWNIRNSSNGISSYWAAGPIVANQTVPPVTVETQGSGVAAATCALRVDNLLHSLQQGGVEGTDTSAAGLVVQS
jgi:hypothetical protein